MRFPTRLQGLLCRDCIGAKFWTMSLVTLVCGWWGVISFFVTPFFLIGNVLAYLGAANLPAPGGGRPKLLGPIVGALFVVAAAGGMVWFVFAAASAPDNPGRHY